MPPKTFDVHYPQPDAPKSSISPLEALEPNPNYRPSIMEKYGYITTGTLAGGLTVAIANLISKRPMSANILLYPVLAAVGAAGAYGLQIYRANQWAERDAIFRHYISLHPEDFPPYNRAKFGELFEKWTPIR